MKHQKASDMKGCAVGNGFGKEKEVNAICGNLFFIKFRELANKEYHLKSKLCTSTNGLQNSTTVALFAGARLKGEGVHFYGQPASPLALPFVNAYNDIYRKLGKLISISNP